MVGVRLIAGMLSHHLSLGGGLPHHFGDETGRSGDDPIWSRAPPKDHSEEERVTLLVGSKEKQPPISDPIAIETSRIMAP
jgi:hypothetical protein